MKHHNFYRGVVWLTKTRVRVRKRIERALRAGQVIRPDRCEDCGEYGKYDTLGRLLLHAHHDDYSKPLKVRWLCRKCHYAWHVTKRAKG